MTYKETLDFFYTQLPMFHRVGAAAFKSDLTNTIALLESLGEPQKRFPAIHVGGTNGKGSVSHLLAAMLQSAGLRVGLYISPHYKDFRERIKINGKMISKKAVVAFVENQKTVIERIEPSFFEMTVALAFDHFAKQKVDIAVVEVGLGGRLDSTNVLSPELSVITNISFDHMALLGSTLSEIAFEKAGIIKPKTPVVIGETEANSAPVFLKKAAAENAPIFFADQILEARELPRKIEKESITHWKSTNYEIVKSEDGQSEIRNLKSEIDLAGPFQAKNVATALVAFDVLRSLEKWSFLKPEHAEKGMAELRKLTAFQGRWQVLNEKTPMILADSAHNEAGLRSVFSEIKKADFGRLLIVMGMVNDKDLDAALALFPTDAHYFFAKANIPRGLDVQILKSKAAEKGLRGRAYSSVKNAFRAAKKQAGAGDLVLVVGSIFTVAEVL